MSNLPAKKAAAPKSHSAKSGEGSSDLPTVSAVSVQRGHHAVKSESQSMPHHHHRRSMSRPHGRSLSNASGHSHRRSVSIAGSSASTLSRAESMTGSQKTDDNISIGVVLFLLLLVVGNFYFFLSYSADSACSGGRYSIAPNVFTLLAGFTTLPMFVTTAFLWKRGRSQRSDLDDDSAPNLGVGKMAFCMTFWNLILAVFGTAMFVGQFEADCRTEPIAIFILLWCASQFAMTILAVAVSCYLTYHMAARSRAAEDIFTAGVAFQA